MTGIGQARDSAGQIASVQVLRAVAALTVVFGHAQHDALIWAGKTGLAFFRTHALPWGAGVDLFFVISGFIMVQSSRNLFGIAGATTIFIHRRLIRIVPLYWLLATLYIALTYGFAAENASKPPLGLAQILSSFLFWPLDIFHDGYPRPIFTLGWTLNYEMFFYLVFAIFLTLPRRRAILALSLLLATGTILGTLIEDAPTSFAFWTKPIVLEFVLGMALAEARLSGIRLTRSGQAIALTIAAALLLSDPMGTASKPQDWITPNDWLRLVLWGIPAALMMAACALPPLVLAKDAPRGGFWIGLGDASYALYLIHPFIIVAMRKIWLRLDLHLISGFWPLVALSVLASIIAAFVVHHGVEKPITAMLRTKPPALKPVAP